MFGVHKRLDDLQSWLASQDDCNLPVFKNGEPQSGNLCDYLVAVSNIYGDQEEFVLWNDDFRQYLHNSEVNLWMLVLQQPGRFGTVEYLLDFSLYDIYDIHASKANIVKSYQYYIDTVIGKTMLGFFYKVIITIK